MDTSVTAQAEELRLLALRLLEVSADSRRMAEEMADMIRGVVAAHCDALEDHAKSVIDSLEMGVLDGPTR